MVLPFKSSSVLIGESQGTPTPRNGAGPVLSQTAIIGAPLATKAISVPAPSPISIASGGERLRHLAAAAEVDDLEIEPVLFEDAELVADIDGNDGVRGRRWPCRRSASSSAAGADAATARAIASGGDARPDAPRRSDAIMKRPPSAARFMRRVRANLLYDCRRRGIASSQASANDSSAAALRQRPGRGRNMANLQLSLAITSNPRTWPIIDGRVKPDGIDFTKTVLGPAEMFWRQLSFAEFDVSEMSMSELMMIRSRGDDRFIGIPVFTTRRFYHTGMLRA